MISVEAKSFDNADEVNKRFANALIESVNVRGQRVNKLTLQPGWKWSVDVKTRHRNSNLSGKPFRTYFVG